MISRHSISSSAVICSSLLRDRATSPPTCKGCGITTSTARGADYHNNINLQMNYWPALTTGLAECAEPLTEFILSMRKPGAVTARKYFNARGWMAGISGNPFGFTSPFMSQDMSWNYNPVAAHWLATHLWEYYEFTRDKRFLSQVAYPVLKECAQFSEDYLWQKPNGTLTAAPSTSPEHGPVD